MQFVGIAKEYLVLEDVRACWGFVFGISETGGLNLSQENSLLVKKLTIL